MRRILFAVLAVLLLAAIGVGTIRVLAGRPGPLPEATDLLVPRGHVGDIAAALQRAHVLADGRVPRFVFVAMARTTEHGTALHAAELRFPAHASVSEVLAVLRHARPVQHLLTIPEGLTAAQIADLLSRAPILTGGIGRLPHEGALLPETYAFEHGTTREALLARMEAAGQRELAAVWAGRDQTVPLSDPQQLLVLASIVERETGLSTERSLVAEVFENRLRAGMKLQSDPTVAYSASGGLGALPRPLTRSDLQQPSPYNTYVIPGLPPGPICAPGLASLQAVAHPAQGALLYFVANGTGGHAFAATLPAHLANVAQFRAFEASHPGQTPTLDPLRPPPQVPVRER